MANLSYRMAIRGGWRINNAFGLPVGLRFGSSPEPSGLLNLTDGSGTDQGNQLYRNVFTLAASGSLVIDLRGGTGELDVVGAALSLALVRAIYLELTTTPAAGVAVRLGPAGATNAFQGPWGGVAAANYSTVQRRFLMDAPADGWTVDGTHKILTISNPGAGSVSGVIEIPGVHT